MKREKREQEGARGMGNVKIENRYARREADEWTYYSAFITIKPPSNQKGGNSEKSLLHLHFAKPYLFHSAAPPLRRTLPTPSRAWSTLSPPQPPSSITSFHHARSSYEKKRSIEIRRMCVCMGCWAVDRDGRGGCSRGWGEREFRL